MIQILLSEDDLKSYTDYDHQNFIVKNEIKIDYGNEDDDEDEDIVKFATEVEDIPYKVTVATSHGFTKFEPERLNINYAQDLLIQPEMVSEDGDGILAYLGNDDVYYTFYLDVNRISNEDFAPLFAISPIPWKEDKYVLVN